MSTKNKIITIILFVLSLFSLCGIIANSYSLATDYMIEMHDGVYLDTSEIKFNGDKLTLEKGEAITSVTVTLVNDSNKDFNDKRVRLMYYNDNHSSVSPGSTDFTYPEGYSLYNKIIDVKADGKTTLTFTEFRNTWFYNDEFRVAFEYQYREGYDLDSTISWWQLDDGNEFKNYHDLTFSLGLIAASISFVICTTAGIIIIIKSKKNKN